MAAGTSTIANWCRTSCELTQDGDDGRYRLRFGKNAERTGLIDENGKVFRDIFIEHSGNRHEPYWLLSPNQIATTKSKYRDAILDTKAKNPEMSLSKIAVVVGCSKAMVQKTISVNPPTLTVHRTRTPLKGVYECTDGEDRTVNSQVYDGVRVYDPAPSPTSFSEPANILTNDKAENGSSQESHNLFGTPSKPNIDIEELMRRPSRNLPIVEDISDPLCNGLDEN
jgi:hypothetical protein